MLCFARLGLYSLFDKNEQPNCLNLIKPTFELMTFYPFQFIGLLQYFQYWHLAIKNYDLKRLIEK